ncbi:MAG: GNAT family N-acetyltransferase [Candidatus Omnitrophota bacterium]|nr:GNAT family N-acetyltransferase [Candidatus Omnitrophota bacterium]
MHNVVIRRGAPEDSEDFSRLMLLTGEDLYTGILGKDAGIVLGRLFKEKRNYFSYEHSYFMEMDGEVAGMTLLYDYKTTKTEFFRFGFLIFKYMKLSFFRYIIPLLRAGRVLNGSREGDLHSSNSALYPKFRAQGLGERLFGIAEEKARREGFRRIVVSVKYDNIAALSLRKKLGYKVEMELPPLDLENGVFKHLQLVKDII